MSRSPDCDQWIQVTCQQLRSLGVGSGGTVLVHSSLSSLGHVPGGAESVVGALLAALGPEGTLLMPALSYESVTVEHPVFDARRTPSCVGAIPEHFRQRPGTGRSLHPTHSVCGVGPRVQVLLADHHHDSTPGGPRSPFRQLRDAGGQILMLGCGLRPNTSMHAVEELVEAPYLFQPGETEFRVTDSQGVEQAVRSKRHSFAGWAQRYDRLENVLSPSQLRQGPVQDATAHLIEVPAMWRVAEQTMRREPYYFVDSSKPSRPGAN